MQYGDILFAGSGETIDEIGKSAVNLLDEEAYCGGDVILFRPGIEVNPRFTGYGVRLRPKRISEIVHGAWDNHNAYLQLPT